MNKNISRRTGRSRRTRIGATMNKNISRRIGRSRRTRIGARSNKVNSHQQKHIKK
jgi:hypothetical protein